MWSSSLALPLNHALHCPRHYPNKSHSLPPLPFAKLSIQLYKSHICFSSSPSSSNPEDLLWLREEQRWLREEQRWLREEQRWLRERESLLAEIQSLKLQVQALEGRVVQGGGELGPETAAAAKLGVLLQVLKEKNLIAVSASGGRVIDEVLEEKVVEEVVRVPEKEEENKRKALRKGSEGEEVREMQEALLALGFYSGEEDMEFSSFSSGTERAVKTWQSTFGAPEDGIMTTELLERLYTEQRVNITSKISTEPKESTSNVSQKEEANGVPVASVTEISEIENKVVKEGPTGVEVSQHRVFLLGENRWEEPSRLIGRDKSIDESKPKKVTTKQCITCRGEGRLMCTECDGSGEPNIEPQFLEWIDEDAKCPYCEGLGYTICDVCDGKTVI